MCSKDSRRQAAKIVVKCMIRLGAIFFIAVWRVGPINKIMKKISIIVLLSMLMLIIIHNVMLNIEINNANGQYLYFESDNERLHVYDSQKGDNTILLLSGFGTGSPIIDFSPLTNELKNKYRIVIIETYGYGFSDDTRKQRTIENITEEIHYIMNKLDIEKYTLLAHSISGIYAQYYIEKYKNEIDGYIGIENAIPQYLEGKEIPGAILIDKITRRSGILRLIGIVSPNKLTDKKMKDIYSENDLKELRKAIIRNYKNAAQLGEIDWYSENVKKVSNIEMDKDIPILFFVSRNNHDNPEKWIKDHEVIINNQNEGRLIEYEGSHYLHHEKYEEISKEIIQFMENY